jgi:hypothetical protein
VELTQAGIIQYFPFIALEIGDPPLQLTFLAFLFRAELNDIPSLSVWSLTSGWIKSPSISKSTLRSTSARLRLVSQITACKFTNLK